VYADKLPPYDPDAEEGVIGSLLIDGAAMHKIADFLQPEDFYTEQNRLLYDACFKLYRRDEAINQITLAQELSRQNILSTCGGTGRLSHLIAICPTSLDIEHYGHIVYRLAVMRRMIVAGDQIKALGYAAEPDVENAVGQAESLLFNVRRGKGKQDLTHIRTVLDKYFETDKDQHEGEIPCVYSSFTGLDEFLDGFQRSDLVIVAGRPSMGKTSLALNIARNTAINQKATVALFSLEMSKDALASRLLSSESGVNSRRVRFGNQTEEEEDKIMEAIGVLSEASIYIDDSAMIRVAEMRSKAMRLHFEHNLDLIIIDYLQLMEGDNPRNENRVQAIAQISRSLKALARELNVPVIAVSQLSRAVDSRPSHVPILSDLRESGSIEQDADVVIFVYREEYYYNEDDWATQFPDREYPRGESDIIIAKHRNGPTGSVKLRFHHELARFENIGSEEARLV